MPGSATLTTGIKDRLVAPLDKVRGRVGAALGSRIWRVFLERWTWPGAERGGVVDPTRTSRAEITCDAASGLGGAPEVTDKKRRQLTEQGIDELGVVLLTRVSRTYREQLDLVGQAPGTSPAANVGWFFVLEDGRSPNGAGTPPRYFVLGEGGVKEDIDANELSVELRRELPPLSTAVQI